MSKCSRLALFLLLFHSVVTGVDAQRPSSSAVFTTPLIVAEHSHQIANVEAGKVLVWNDTGKLYVRINLDKNYTLKETELAVGKTLSSIPVTHQGEPLIQQFPFHDKSQGSTTYTYSVDLVGLHFSEGENLCIALHASIKPIEKDSFGNKGVKSAWAKGVLFENTRKEANYFTLKVQPIVVLPDNNIGLVVFAGQNTYMDSYLSNVPEGLDITNERYNGWCVDRAHDIFQGVYYQTKPVSSYDPTNLKGRLKSAHWDELNYIVNHKQGTKEDIQEAIWYFIGGGDLPATDIGKTIVQDALKNGEGFVPTLDETLLIVLDSGEDVQLTIIELPPATH